ncbi:MAG: Hpt domain-containing protein [Deltaproteobacteria bacterium]|nr:Hpt domain-containing protein [Deltaproteobacteria bacterium]
MSENATTALVIDRQKALDRLYGDAELYETIVDIFLSTAGPEMTRFENAVQARDLKEACAAAHWLKSSAGNIGAMVLERAALTAEVAARKGETQAVVDSLAPFLDAYRRVVEELTKTS